MIKLDITGRNFGLDAKIKRYVEKKLGGLDKYLPRDTKGTSGLVILEEDPSGREDNRFVCELKLNLPGPDIVAKDATVSIYAAVDIVEAKAKAQILKYKAKHQGETRRGRRLARRLLGRS